MSLSLLLLSWNPVILWLAGNYTLVQEGNRGGATRLNKEAVSRKPGVIEDIEQFSCQRPIHQNMEKTRSSQKYQVPGARAPGWHVGGFCQQHGVKCPLSFVCDCVLENSVPAQDTGVAWSPRQGRSM